MKLACMPAGSAECLAVPLQMLGTTDAYAGWGRGYSSRGATGNDLLWVIADSLARGSDVAWCSVGGPVVSVKFELDAGCELFVLSNYDDQANKCTGSLTLYEAGPATHTQDVLPSLCMAIQCTNRKLGPSAAKAGSIVKAKIPGNQVFCP